MGPLDRPPAHESRCKRRQEYAKEKEEQEAGRWEHRADGKAQGGRKNVNRSPFHVHIQVDFSTFIRWPEYEGKQ